MKTYWQWQGSDLLLNIYVQPNAKRSEIIGMHDLYLKIKLAAPAVDDKANTELIKFLADYFGVAKQQVTLLKGLRSRIKQVLIKAPQQHLSMLC